MKNVRYQPNNPTETRTIPARTQIAKPNSELGISDLHLNTVTCIGINPRQPKCPAAADNPGWMRWSPEDGEGGLRRVLLPRPLVRRKAIIKSTRAMRYSSLRKPKQTPKAKRSFLINNKGNQQTASQSTCPQVQPEPRGTVLDASASSYLPRSISRLQVKKNARRGTSYLLRNIIHPKFKSAGTKSRRKAHQCSKQKSSAPSVPPPTRPK